VANLVIEVVLRLFKVLAASAIALVLYIVLVGPLGNAPSIELALLSWLAGAAFILLVETSPI
jgi:hypothetical protein